MDIEIGKEIVNTINLVIFSLAGLFLLWAFGQFYTDILPHIRIMRKAKYMRKDKFIIFKGNEHLLRKGDYLILEAIADTDDFSILALAGGAYYGHLQKWVMDSDDTKHAFSVIKYKTKGKYRDRCTFFDDIIHGDSTYITPKTFYMPQEMTFRLWIERKTKEKWWYRMIADRSMHIYNRNMRIDKEKRTSRIEYEKPKILKTA